MKRNIYYVKSYDSKINRIYHNYKNACNYCIKLIQSNIDCGVYVFNSESNEYDLIIGC